MNGSWSVKWGFCLLWCWNAAYNKVHQRCMHHYYNNIITSWANMVNICPDMTAVTEYSTIVDSPPTISLQSQWHGDHGNDSRLGIWGLEDHHKREGGDFMDRLMAGGDLQNVQVVTIGFVFVSGVNGMRECMGEQHFATSVLCLPNIATYFEQVW